MKWKHLTQGQISYFVNLEQVAALQSVPRGTIIIFSAKSDDGRLAITVEQSAAQILQDEEIH